MAMALSMLNQNIYHSWIFFNRRPPVPKKIYFNI